MLIPALLILLLCMGEFGRAAYYKVTLQSAVRDGARLAALDASRPDVEDAVRKAAGNVPVDQVVITKTKSGRTSLAFPNPSVDVTVKIQTTFRLKALAKLGLPENLRQLSLTAESRVPVVR